jgi:hypothetical protein
MFRTHWDHKVYQIAVWLVDVLLRNFGNSS